MYRQPTGLPIPKPISAGPKPPKPMPKKTKKQAQIERAYQTVVAIIRQNRPPICEGCGDKNALLLDASHLASRKHYPELISDPRNIRLHCRPCHNKWEGNIPGREEMLDYQQNRAILEKICPEALSKLDLKQAA